MSILDNEGHDPQGFLNTPAYHETRDKVAASREALIAKQAAENERLRAALEAVWSQIESAEFDDIEDDDDLVVITIESPQARAIRAALGHQQRADDSK